MMKALIVVVEVRHFPPALVGENRRAAGRTPPAMLRSIGG